MGKSNSIFSCTNCGAQYSKWVGQCSECSEWGTVEEEVVLDTKSVSSVRSSDIKKPRKVADITKEPLHRISTGLVEFDRVLGKSYGDDKAGFVPGQVMLLSGEPGIGKSTILLQLVFKTVSQGKKCLYVSGEESEGQIALRVERLLHHDSNAGSIIDDIEILHQTLIEGVLEIIDSSSPPDLIIIDSIQTMVSDDSKSIAGSVSQVKTVVDKLVRYAKTYNVAMVVVGHITKSGSIAGPKLLEHMVDTVLQLEGDDQSDIRMMRSLKNRFGPTNEVGLFRMMQSGLEDLSDPSELFAGGGKKDVVGVCRSIVIEGQRPMIVEVQALTSQTPFSLPKRVAEGVPVARIQRIAAILSKYARVNFSEQDIYIKIAGNIKVQDPAIDLAIALALISTVKNKKVVTTSVAIGELHLTGGVAAVPRLEDRIQEAKRLGYKTVASSKNLYAISDLLKSAVFAS
ncbi:DNA repair protein RadA [Candidatus Dojkabacteria bacterium]|uniref:DNA repair protein RadA n=1 Tax=Candidatus Dojkabacteria bacterium TaxID=2099670 RepID=A0A955L8F8_9BACT|nr:DNA repair protein RadA [Candidatus Dojkabacteria bacterium]